MYLLKSNKLFVTNLSIIIILGILILSLKLLGSARLRHYQKKHTSWFGVENNFWVNWQPSWILSPYVIKKQSLYNFIICPTLKNIYKVCVLVIMRSWGIEYPIFSFWYFLWWPFWKCSRRGSASQNFPVNITDSYSIGWNLAGKYQFVDVREGYTMGLPRLQPTKLCLHDGPEIMILGLFLRGFPAQFWHKYQPQQHHFGIKWKIITNIFHLCVNFSDEIYH